MGWLDRLLPPIFRRRSVALPPVPPGAEALFEAVRWISAAENPWGQAVLDVAPVTTGIEPRLEPAIEAVALGWTHEDGLGLGPLQLPEGPLVKGELTAPLTSADPALCPDGAVFRPQHVTERFALLLRDGQLWLLDGRTRAVCGAAAAERRGAQLVLGPLRVARGGLLHQAAEGDDGLLWGIFAWLFRSHALGELCPAPLPPRLAEAPAAAALWASAWLGRRCLALAPRPPEGAPSLPLRVDGPLMLAAQAGDLDRLDAALRAGAHPAAPGSFFGYTPLHAAAAMGHLPLVARLLAAGAPVEARAEDGATPLLAAAAQHGPNTAPAIGALIVAGADLEARLSERGERAVHLAAQAGRAEALARLLGAGAAVDAATAEGFRALHMAAELGRADLVTLLLGAGADPAAPSASGHTPAALAAAKGHAALAAALAAAPAGVR